MSVVLPPTPPPDEDDVEWEADRRAIQVRCDSVVYIFDVIAVVLDAEKEGLL